MAEHMVSLVKRAAVQAVEAGKPVNIRYGTVISVSPLRVYVDQKMTLSEGHLVLTRNVTDHMIRTISGDVLVLGGLSIGERVVMLRLQGGQHTR